MNSVGGKNSIAIGSGSYFDGIDYQSVGCNNQGDYCIALGYNSGNYSQKTGAISCGYYSGFTNQGTNAISIGYQSGSYNQGTNSVSIGYLSGYVGQGSNAISLGPLAGQTNQASNSIIINASGSILNNTTASSTCIKPVRNITGDNSTDWMFYNSTTSEVSYLSGGQGGTMTVNSVFANVGTSYDTNSIYHLYFFNTATDGTYGFFVVFSDEGSVNAVSGASNNLVFQVVAPRQIQVKSSNAATYTGMRFRLIKIVGV
jgi:hypothetical protein